MKKQFENSKLTFNKVSVTELNDDKLLSINGGTSETAALSIALIVYLYLEHEKEVAATKSK